MIVFERRLLATMIGFDRKLLYMRSKGLASDVLIRMHLCTGE